MAARSVLWNKYSKHGRKTWLLLLIICLVKIPRKVNADEPQSTTVSDTGTSQRQSGASNQAMESSNTAVRIASVNTQSTNKMTTTAMNGMTVTPQTIPTNKTTQTNQSTTPGTSTTTPTTSQSHTSLTVKSPVIPQGTPTDASTTSGAQKATVTPKTTIKPTVTSTKATTTTQSTTVDPCLTAPCQNGGTCLNNAGTAKCNCTKWYKGESCQTDVNECAQEMDSPCQKYETCNNTIGSYTCICKSGFIRNGTVCDDIDECKTLNICDTHASCSNTLGSYNCSCKTGFSGNGTSCTDVDECKTSNKCDTYASCFNTLGSYNCSCKTGFSGNGTNCTDNNECTSGENNCHQNATCINTPGNYTCNCNEGFSGNGTFCQDIDECALHNPCDKYATCNNNIGSYTCTCENGFIGNGKVCEDIPECKTNDTICRNGGVCLELPGKYHCWCSDQWTGVNCTTDVNECDVDNPCGINATCNNTHGGFTCNCPEWFRGNPHQKCTRETLLKITKNATKLIEEQREITPSIDIQYFGKAYKTIYVSRNGFISLGREVPDRYPPLEWPKNIPIIAALWSNIDVPANESSDIFIDTSQAAMDEYKAIKSNSKATFAVIVTWKNVAPYSGKETLSKERADFQLVFAAGKDSTDIIMNYDQERFNWEPGRAVAMGHSQKSGSTLITFNNSNILEVNKQSNVDIPGRWEYDVTGTKSNPEIDSAIKCKRWKFNGTVNTAVQSARTKTDPCPCTLHQAADDTRYENTRSVGFSICYRRRVKPQAIGREICCYGENGTLQEGYPTGGYLLFEDDTSLIEDGHKYCCTNTDMCNLFYEVVPSRNCSGYIAPGEAAVYGDPHFITFDGLKYTFNGIGEYKLLDVNNGSYIVHIRLARSGNGSHVDAVVVQDETGDVTEVKVDNPQIWIVRNKDKSGYLNGVTFIPVNSATLADFSNVQATDSKVLILSPSTGFSIKVIVTPWKTLNVFVYDDCRPSKVRGLLGNNNGIKDDDIQSYHSSPAVDLSTEKGIYDVVTTWLVDESLIAYKLFGGTFAKHNSTSSKPSVFLSDLNNTELVSMCPHITMSKVNGVCGNNTACRFDTAATCNVQHGNYSRSTEVEFEQSQLAKLNRPPVFSGVQTHLLAHIHSTVSTTMNITDDTTITLSCNTSIPLIKLTDSSQHVLTWNVGKAFRNLSTPLYVKVIATDTLGASSMYWPVIKYCGCENSSQCVFDGPVLPDRSVRATCNCGPDRTGQYCEQEIPSCVANPCYPGVVCNEGEAMDSQCGPCPANLVGDGFSCYDVNECNDLKTIPCSHDCMNTMGSYICSCPDGYTLEGNTTCIDNDECSSSPCSDLQVCENTLGSYHCNCRAGFFQQEGDRCHKANVFFAGILSFTYTKTPTESEIFQQLDKMLNSTGKLIYIQILSVTESSSRTKRSVPGLMEKAFIVDYEAQFKPGTVVDTIKKNLSRYLDKQGCNKEDQCLSDQNFYLDKAGTHIYGDSESPLCFTGRSTCDPASTDCIVREGAIHCDCKPGFKPLPLFNNICEDINECDTNTSLCAPGTCANYIGNWECNCPSGFREIISGQTKACQDLCSPNPCKNGGKCNYGTVPGDYVCKCDDKWSGKECQEENSEISKLKTTVIAVGATVGGLCFLMLCAMLGMYRGSYPQEAIEMQEGGRGLDTEQDTETGKMNDESEPLTVLNKETLEAKGSPKPSFLHAGPASDRKPKTKGGQYEYF